MDLDEVMAAAAAAGEPVGWQVTDPDGNVVSSGTVSIARVTTQGTEFLGGDSNG